MASWGARQNAPASKKSCADALSWAPAASKGKAEDVPHTSWLSSALSPEKRNETPGANCLTTLVREKTKKGEESRWSETTASMACSSTAASLRSPVNLVHSNK